MLYLQLISYIILSFVFDLVELIEAKSAQELFENPEHEYTQKLLSAIPKIEL